MPTDIEVLNAINNLEDSQKYSETPTIYTVSMTLADTEYSQALPDDTRKIEFRCRDAVNIRFAYETGKVAAPTEPYRTLLATEVKSEDTIKLSSKILYFACSDAGKTMEVEVWT
jgi:hypothetical protein